MGPGQLITNGFEESLLIATTKWSERRLDREDKRKEELSRIYPNKVHQFEGTTKSAWDIIDACPEPPMIELSNLGDRLKAVLPQEKRRRIRLFWIVLIVGPLGYATTQRRIDQS